MTAGSFGYGFFTPWSMSHEANATDAIIRSIIAQMETMRLVEVMAVHPGDGTPPVPGTVDVHPLVNQIDGMGNPTPHGTVYGVPFLRLQGGDGGVICDPAVGDVGYVVCEARDISGVKITGKQANPGSRRMYDLADGVYVGRLLGDAAPVQYLWFSPDGVTLLDRNGNKWVGSSTGIDVTPKSGHPETIHGNEVITGTLTVDGTSDLKGNVHAEGDMQVDGGLMAASLGIDGESATIKRILTGSLTTSGTVPPGTTLFAAPSLSGAQAGDFVVLGNPDSGLVVLFPVAGANVINIFAFNPTASSQAVSIATSILVIGTT